MAAPFLRLGRAGFTAPLCKNGDATWGPRAPRTVDCAEGVRGALRVQWNEQLREGWAVDGTKKMKEQQ